MWTPQGYYQFSQRDHFGAILPSQSLGIVLKKQNLTQQKQTTQEQNSLS